MQDEDQKNDCTMMEEQIMNELVAEKIADGNSCSKLNETTNYSGDSVENLKTKDDGMSEMESLAEVLVENLGTKDVSGNDSEDCRPTHIESDPQSQSAPVDESDGNTTELLFNESDEQSKRLSDNKLVDKYILNHLQKKPITPINDQDEIDHEKISNDLKSNDVESPVKEKTNVSNGKESDAPMNKGTRRPSRDSKEMRRPDYSQYVKKNEHKPSHREFRRSKDAYSKESAGMKNWLAGSKKASGIEIDYQSIIEKSKHEKDSNEMKKELDIKKTLPSSYRIPRKRSLGEPVSIPSMTDLLHCKELHCKELHVNLTNINKNNKLAVRYQRNVRHSTS